MMLQINLFFIITQARETEKKHKVHQLRVSTIMSLQLRKAAFVASGAVGLGTSAYIFHTLTDFSQAIIQRQDRNDFMASYKHRHEMAAVGMSGIVSNLAIFATTPKAQRPVPTLAMLIWNGVSLGLWYGGYLNPEIMLRPRNHNALYLKPSEASKIIKDSDICIITQLEDQPPKAFPDAQVRFTVEKRKKDVCGGLVEKTENLPQCIHLDESFCYRFPSCFTDFASSYG